MPNSAHHWLPDRHVGVAATLSHADELVAQVSDLLFPYQTQANGIIRLREVPSGQSNRTVVTGVAPIPQKLPLLVADALVNLRAALEHLLFAETEFLEGGPLPERAARLVEMPAADTYEKFQSWVQGRARHGPASLKNGSDLVRRIEGLQPFHRWKTPEAHPLARLVSHTNHAKHRTPAIMAVRLATMYRDDNVPRSTREIQQLPQAPVQIGDVLAETSRGDRHVLNLFPTVGINRPGSDQWPVLMQELDEIVSWVRTQAVPRLITGTEPPTPVLPTRYDITVGHEDERSAIAAGFRVSSADRHTQRLLAASSRLDLVGLIGSLGNSPTDERTAAWLAQLTDEQVLDRIRRLKVSHDRDPDIQRRNLSILTCLRDEALAFDLENRPN